MSDDRDPYEDEDNDRQMQITDPDEHHKTRRLNQIHNAREQFTRTYRLAEADHRSGPKGRRAVAAVALDYVRQLEPLVKRSDSDLLEETVTVGGQTVTISTLLDQGGTVTTTNRTRENRRLMPRTETTEHRMSKPTALKVVRLCDDWLDQYIDFDIEDTPDEWQV